ncbi:MAG: ester cyclase [Candidatus Heimdallarchaeota archaeon]
MSAESNKIFARSIYEAFNTRNLDALDKLMDRDFVDHYPGPEQEPGVKGIKEVWAQIWAKFPEVYIVVEDMISEGDKVATRLALQRKASGDRGVVKVGRIFEIFRIVDGKVVELWNMFKWIA